jgi:hypothetical protein
MDYYRKYLKYKEKYLSLKAQLDGGLITHAVRPVMPGDKKVFIDTHFNIPNRYIAYKEDNPNITNYKIGDKQNTILNVRVCTKNCDDHYTGEYELKSIEAVNIIKLDGSYVIIESDINAELKEPIKQIKPALLLKQKRIINGVELEVDVITDINIDRMPNGALKRLNILKDTFIKNNPIDCAGKIRVNLIKNLCYNINLLNAICSEITSNIVLNMEKKDMPINIKSTYTKNNHVLNDFRIQEGIDIPQTTTGGDFNIWIGINFSDEWKVNFIPLTPKGNQLNFNPTEDKFNIIKSICEKYDDYILEYKKNNIVYFTITTTKSNERGWNKISYVVKLNTEKFLVPS